MRKKFFAVCGVIVLGPVPAAFAQRAPDAFDTCALQQDSAARLACFDQQLAARRAPKPASAAASAGAAASTSAAASASAPSPAGAAVPPAAAESTVGLDAQQLHKAHPESAKTAPIFIEGKVVAVIPRRSLISAFQLDSGQVWEQVETVDGLWIKPNETVTIREGMLGGFLLKSADGHLVRVKRVK